MATEMAAAVQRPRRLWQLPTFVLGLAAVWAAATYVSPPPGPAEERDAHLDRLAALLDRSPFDATAIEPLMRPLAESANPTPRLHFLLGSGYVALANRKPTDSTDQWKLALQHFALCDAATMSPVDAAKFNFRSAVAQAAVGQGEPGALIAALMNSPPGEDRGECPRLIAECALRLPQPDLVRARDELTSYLGGPHRASSAAASRYKFRLAELQLMLGQSDKARAWLLDIDASASIDVQAAAKTMLARLAMAAKNWPEAVAHLEAALALPGLSPAETASIHYQIGEAAANAGNLPKAAASFEQASREPGKIGGLASLKLAVLRSLDPLGQGRRGDAVDWLERAVAQLPPESVTAEDRRQADGIVQVCLREGDFAGAMRAANAYGKIADKNADLASRADIQAAWGDALKKSGDATAQAKFADSAREFLALAEQSAKPEEKTRYWKRAAVLFRQANDGAAALKAVNAVLMVVPADAEMNLSRAELLPTSDFAGVREALEKAMAAPGAIGLNARLKLALLFVNRGQELIATISGSPNADAIKKEAEQMGQFGRDLLRQTADAATVPAEARAAHEQALFELGRLWLRDAKYADAEACFKKQLSLYAESKYSGYGRLWLVCTLLQQARGHDSSKRILEEALGHLKPLMQSSDPYLRTYGEIWTANTMLELGNAAAAVPMAKELMTKYRGKPEELVAGKLLFYAYLKQETPDTGESARTLDRMDAAFATLPKTAYPNDPEYSHEKWKTELPRLREELRKFAP